MRLRTRGKTSQQGLRSLRSLRLPPSYGSRGSGHGRRTAGERGRDSGHCGSLHMAHLCPMIRLRALLAVPAWARLLSYSLHRQRRRRWRQRLTARSGSSRCAGTARLILLCTLASRGTASSTGLTGTSESSRCARCLHGALSHIYQHLQQRPHRMVGHQIRVRKRLPRDRALSGRLKPSSYRCSLIGVAISAYHRIRHHIMRDGAEEDAEALVAQRPHLL